MEETLEKPKPLVEIGGKPILWHIMKSYSHYGINEFVIFLGYKGDLIKKYFSDLHQNDFNCTFVNTGLETMTGGRLKRLKSFLKDEAFLLTYGDGISDVNINKLIKFHKKTNNIVTLTSVRPPARFGSVKFKNDKITSFREKSSLDEGWINGGFFVMDPKIFNYLKNDQTFLEREPLEIISKKKLLGGYKHKNFWQCMDTLRDKEVLETAFKKGLIKFEN